MTEQQAIPSDLIRLSEVKALMQDPRKDHSFRQWAFRAELRGDLPTAYPFGNVLYWSRAEVLAKLAEARARRAARGKAA